MPKQRSRRGEPLPHDAALVLRGDELAPHYDVVHERCSELVTRFVGPHRLVENPHYEPPEGGA